MHKKISVLIASISIIFVTFIFAAMPLSAEVNPDGSFSHSIPIEVPPGTRGMQPELALVYNSNNGNGMVGIGWQLAGLPVITRNTAFPLNYDANDHFIGPGGQLVRVGSVYHTQYESFSKFIPIGTSGNGPTAWFEIKPDGTRYRYGSKNACLKTETYGDTIRLWALSHVIDVHGNSYSVQYQEDNGTLYPSRIDYTSKSVEFIYERRSDYSTNYRYKTPVTMKKRLAGIIVKEGLKNSKGNLVRKYILEYDESPLLSISTLRKVRRIGSEGGELPPISFTWETTGIDTDANEWEWEKFNKTINTYTTEGLMFLADMNGDSTDDINAFYVKGYVPDMPKCGDYSITYNNIINSVYFNMNKDATNKYDLMGLDYDSTKNYDFSRFKFADVYGTGKTQTIYIDDDGTLVFAEMGEADRKNTSIRDYLGSNPNPERLFLTDLDGDNTNEILYLCEDNTLLVSYYHNGTWYLDSSARFQNLGVDPKRYFFVDITGDNKAELLYLNDDGKFSVYSHRKCTWEGNNVWSYVKTVNGVNSDYSRYKFGDINGDGLVDIIYIAPNGIIFFIKNKGNGFITSAGFTGIGTSPDEYAVRDINGDGSFDIIDIGVGSSITIYFSSGDSFVLQTIESDQGDTYKNYIFGDLNGDGAVDILHKKSLPDSQSKCGTCYYKAYYNCYSTNVYEHGFCMGPGGSFCSRCPTEYQDILTTVHSFEISYLNQPETRPLLSSIENPAGGAETIHYKPAAFSDNAVIQDYKKKIKPQYGYKAQYFRRFLVTDVTSKDGRGADYTTTYSYNNGMMYVDDVVSGSDPLYYSFQSLLFESVTVKDAQSGRKTVTYYNVNDHRFQQKPRKVEKYDSAGTLTSAIAYEYYGESDEPSSKASLYTKFTVNDTYVDDPYTIFVRTKGITETTYEGGNPLFVTRTDFTYNDYGAVASSARSSTGANTITTENEYTHDLDNWILNKPVSIQVSSPDGILHKERFSYDIESEDVTGVTLLSSRDAYLNTENRWVSESYTYTAQGNIQTITDALGNVNTIVYDDVYHTFPSRIVDPYNNETSFVYDYRFGTVSSVTDANGNTTSSIFDEFGRLRETVGPDGVWTKKINYHDALSGKANQQYTEVILNSGDNGETLFKRDFFDGLGRVYKTTSSGINGLAKVRESLYNSQGQVWKVSNPYLEGCGDVYYTAYEYDPAGRVQKVIEPGSGGRSFTNISYSSDSGALVVTSVNGNNQSYTRRYNSLGQLIAVKEPERAARYYTYDDAGRPDSFTNQDGTKTTVTYDSLGRKRALVDPNTGTSRYTYDDLGRVTSETDARGQTMIYEYEKTRLVREYSGDGTMHIDYAYGSRDDTSIQNAIGRVVKVTTDESVSNYSYDSMGNVLTHSMSIDQFTFGMTTSHDRLGRIRDIRYPDGSLIERHYGEDGSIAEVTSNYTSPDGGLVVDYRRGLSEHSSNPDKCTYHTMKRTTANGVETLFEYDPASLRLTDLKTQKLGTGSIDTDIEIHYNMSQGAAGGSGMYDDKHYSYDNVGNITEINDSVDPGLSESFSYDALNRVVKAEGFYGKQLYEYDAHGNLRNKGLPDTVTGGMDVGIEIHMSVSGASSAPGGLALEYNDPHHPYAVTGDSAGNTYAYDSSGNMTGRNSTELFYDAKNRLAGLSTGERFTYDHSGERAKQELPDGRVVYSFGGIYEVVVQPDGSIERYNYIYGQPGDLAARINARNAETVASANFYFESTRYSAASFGGLCLKAYYFLSYITARHDFYADFIIFLFVLSAVFVCGLWLYNTFLRKLSVSHHRWAVHAVHVMLLVIMSTWGVTGCYHHYFPMNSSSIKYFHPNHVGSIAYITDNDGNKAAAYAYTPYGERIEEYSRNTDISNIAYTAQQFDESTGLYYYGARYYDPRIGRFTQPDSIIDGVDTTQGWNRYMYVHGNPISNNDPTGNSSLTLEHYMRVDGGGGGSSGGGFTFIAMPSFPMSFFGGGGHGFSYSSYSGPVNVPQPVITGSPNVSVNYGGGNFSTGATSNVGMNVGPNSAPIMNAGVSNETAKYRPGLWGVGDWLHELSAESKVKGLGAALGIAGFFTAASMGSATASLWATGAKVVDSAFGAITNLASYVATTPAAERTGWGYAGAIGIGGIAGYGANVLSDAVIASRFGLAKSVLGTSLIGGFAEIANQTLIGGRSFENINRFNVIWQGGMFGIGNLMGIPAAGRLFDGHILPGLERMPASVLGGWGMEQFYINGGY